MWSGPEPELGHDWCPNHFLPLLYAQSNEDNVALTIYDASKTKTVESSSSVRVLPRFATPEIQKDEDGCDMLWFENLVNTSSSRQVFLNPSDVIERIIHSNTDNVLDFPPKMSFESAISIKNSSEKKSSVGEDGSGIWRQGRPVEVSLVLTENGSYQTVQQHPTGFWYYITHLGNQYIPQHVEYDSILILKR